ncbi:MAG: hypothetical protein NDI67_14185 [Sulfuritalea sp.]|nr:hypothetical protein [Sulfuritalea sp.]
MRLISTLLFASATVLAMSAAAQTRIYCCNDAKGRKVCGDFLPTECHGRAYEERDNRGFVSKTVEAPLSAEQQARRDAEVLRKQEEAKQVAEERRRTLALLATYSSDKDILSARDRALAEVQKNIKQAQQRLDEADKKKKKLESDKEFYKGKPLPDQVKADIRDNEKEIAAQKAAVAAKTKEADEVRARFDDERKRYLELTGKKPTEDLSPAAGAPAEKAAEATPAAPTAPAPAKPAAKK